MYADVVVLTYQSPEIGTYTYEIPESLSSKIKVGQLVEIPFGTRTPLGLIVDVKKQKTEGVETRPIANIFYQLPILLPYQIKLLKWMSSYYLSPMVNCLESMLPEIPKRLSNFQSPKSSDKKFRQTIVLTSNLNRLPETLAKFPNAKNHIIYHNQLTMTERFKNWLKAIQGSVNFIFGLRSAIFVPCPNLEKIIIFDEHDGTYKDPRSPYFDTLSIAEKLKELTGAKIQIEDNAPKINTYFVHKHELNIPKITNKQVRIVSMVKEREAGNKSPISYELESHLRKIYKSGGRSLLFLNKKIESGQIYCRACKHQYYIKREPTECLNCKSPDFFFYSLNIASLANSVRQIIPGVTFRLVAEGIKSPPISYKLTSVDIATSFIFYAQIFNKYDLVAHISTDAVLNIPDFTSSEKTFSQISDLKRLTKEKGILILQTYNPQNTVIQNAANNNYLEFYNEQLDQKKQLFYPPFSLLVKLTIKGKNKEKILEKTTQFLEKLKERQVKDNEVSILGPYQSVFLSKFASYNIILKKRLKSYSLDNRQKALNELSIYLKGISRDWQITVEPTSLN